MRASILATALLAPLALACADLDAGADDQEIVDAKSDKTAAASPSGRFAAGSDAKLGDFATLTLNPDKTFSRTFRVIDCLPRAACAPETGTYKLTKSTTTDARFIRFYDDGGEWMDRYRFTYEKGTLRLTLDGSARSFSMVQAAPRVVDLQDGEIPSAIGLFNRLHVPVATVNGVCSEEKLTVKSRVRGFNPASWTASLDGNDVVLAGDEIRFAVDLFSRAGVPAVRTDGITSVSTATIGSRSCELSPARWTLTFDPGDLAPRVTIDEGSDGQTVRVVEGQDLELQLSENPTTGFVWKVTATDRTFGYPEENFVASSEAIGAGGLLTLTWKTLSPLSLTGKHQVELSLARGAETSRTLRFTVDVQPAS